MSNSLAVATVTAVISDIIRQSIQVVEHTSGPIELRYGRPPSDQPPWVGVNLFLFRTQPNAFRRNDDLPTRNGSGEIVRSPQVAIDLEYLITFYGDDIRFEPQRLLGATMVGLAASPMLTPQRIRETIASAGPGGPLWTSDLDRQETSVRLNPLELDLDMLSRMWACFQSPFALTIGLLASPVLIDAQVAGRRALPVTSVAPAVVPAILDAAGTNPAVATFGQTQNIVVLSSTKISGVHAVLNETARVAAAPVDQGYSVDVSSNVLAGQNMVRLSSKQSSGATAVSEPVRFIVRPAVIAQCVFDTIENPVVSSYAAKIATVSVPLQPDVSSAPFTLALYPAESEARSYTFSSALYRTIAGSLGESLDTGAISKDVRDAFSLEGLTLSRNASLTVVEPSHVWIVEDSKAWYRLVSDGTGISLRYGFSMRNRTATLAFEVSGVAPGRYLLSVLCGDDASASSALGVSPQGRFVSPLLEVPPLPARGRK